MTQTGFIELQPVQERRPSRRGRWVAVVAIFFLLIALGAAAGYYEFGHRRIDPSGGMYAFHRVELDVPLFSQGDPAWGGDPLANSVHTMGQVGCAVTSAAMVMKSYGIDTDPGRLNNFLRDNGGFDENNDILWEGPPKMAPQTFQKAYEDLPSYYLIDSNLWRGNPVIVRLKLRSGVTHFVVIMGKDGFDYLIRDPAGAGIAKGVYPLREIGRPIEALRFYERPGGS